MLHVNIRVSTPTTPREVQVKLSRWILIVALATGGFGIGVSEFLIMGLLPQIAANLLPDLMQNSRDTALAATGSLVSAYALGVVVGIFTTPMLVRRLSERHALLVCVGSMMLWTLLTAVAPTLALAIPLRFLAALTHASFIGVGAMAIAHLMGTHSYGRGSAIVHGGLALANLAGVPALTGLGTVLDWRLLLGSCALFFAAPFVALLVIDVPGRREATTTVQAAQMRGRTVVLVLSAAVISAAGAFAIVTYVAPITLWARGNDTWLSAAIAMLAFGIGMNLGNFIAGLMADRAAERAFGGAIAAGAVGAALLVVPGIGGAGAMIGVLLIGFLLGAHGPSGQVLYLRELSRFPRLASSLPSGSGNMGSFVGALIGAGILANFGPGMISVGVLILLGGGMILFLAYLRGERAASHSA